MNRSDQGRRIPEPCNARDSTNVVENEVNELIEILSGTYTESERKEKFDDELADNKTNDRNCKLYQAAKSATESDPKDGYDLEVLTAHIHVALVSDREPRVERKVVLWIDALGQEESELLHFRCWRPYKLSPERADAADHHSEGSGKDGSMFSKGEIETPLGSFSDGSRNFSKHTVPESNGVTFIGSGYASGD